MRTINKNKNTGGKVVVASSLMKVPLDISDRQPCYYANSSKENGRLVWKVGVDSEDSDEHAFEMDDVPEHKSERFACSLLDVYKKGGKEAVEDWLKNGCP